MVQTAWALLGLLAGQCKDAGALERGVRFLMARQRPNGACVAPWFIHTCVCIYMYVYNVYAGVCFLMARQRPNGVFMCVQYSVFIWLG